MAEQQSGEKFVIGMARAMLAANRLGDFVVGLAHEGAIGALEVVLANFGVDAFKPGKGGKDIGNYEPRYMVDAYDAAVVAKRPNVVEWLASNKIPVHGVLKNAGYRTEPEDRPVHYSAVLRAVYDGDEASLASMVNHGVINMQAPLLDSMIELGRKKGTDDPIAILRSNWEVEVVGKVHQPRLLDLCAIHKLPNAIRAILDAGYEATPSFFVTALALRDGQLIEQSIGKAANIEVLANNLLAAATDANMMQSMRFALAHGAKPDADIVGYGSYLQPRPLFFCKSAEAVHLLCDAGAYIEARNEEGNTPLLYFASGAQSGVRLGEIMTALVERGANVDRRNKNDRTIGQLAARCGEDVKRIIRAAKTGQLVKTGFDSALPILDDEVPAGTVRARGMSPI